MHTPSANTAAKRACIGMERIRFMGRKPDAFLDP